MSSSLRMRAVVTGLCLVLSAVTVRPQAPPLPTITLAPGEFYFRVDGTPSVVLGTNPTGWDQGLASPTRFSHFEELFGFSLGDERIVRIHVTNGKVPNPTAAGLVDEAWASFWDQVFDRAEANGLIVLPVFDVHADWREDLTGAQSWRNNIFNVASTDCVIDMTKTCGPAVHPWELFTPGATQDLWLDWAEALVNRWKGRPNILGWEVFSELDLVTKDPNLTQEQVEDGVAAFVEAAALRIRSADPGRPVTASLSGIIDWDGLSTSSIDFVQIHPYANIYPHHGDLDDMIIDTVRTMRAYGKPVMIGESGLSAASPLVCTAEGTTDADDTWTSTLEMSARASVGINHAVWAAVVSGAATARMLWFEDGYDKYHFNPPCLPNPEVERLNLRSAYQDASVPVVRFLQGVDYTGFEPIAATLSAGITGAALGNGSVIIGWVRDLLSAAPPAAPDPDAWPATWGWPDNLAALGSETVTVTAPGVSHDWLVTFYDTTAGYEVSSVYTNQAADGSITATLPSFTPSIAFQIRAVPPIPVEIDIRPRATQNRINIRSRRPVVFPVAILTTSTAAGDTLDFDASSVVVSSVLLGPAAAAPVQDLLVDVDTDGDLDLALWFDKRAVGFACGDVIGVLTGETANGRAIEGSDVVRIVGGCGGPP